MPIKIPAIVLGGTGYVSGELLRLIAGHPHFNLAGVMSDSSPGELAGKYFPHLAGTLGDTVQVAGGHRGTHRERTIVGGVLRGAALCGRGADRFAVEGRRSRGHETAIRRHLCRFPLRERWCV